jgi:hypothetical protein
MLKIDGHDDAIIGPAMVWTEDHNIRTCWCTTPRRFETC